MRKERRNACQVALVKFVVKRPKEVEEDQLAAALWYDAQQPGLGDDFLDETEAVITALSDNAIVIFDPICRCPLCAPAAIKRYGVQLCRAWTGSNSPRHSTWIP